MYNSQLDTTHISTVLPVITDTPFLYMYVLNLYTMSTYTHVSMDQSMSNTISSSWGWALNRKKGRKVDVFFPIKTPDMILYVSSGDLMSVSPRRAGRNPVDLNVARNTLAISTGLSLPSSE